MAEQGKKGKATLLISVLLALVLLGGFLDLVVPPILFTRVANMAASTQRDAKVSIYLKDEAASVDVVALQQAILADTANVKSVQYVSKKQALQRYKVMMRDDPETYPKPDGNPFPASLEVSLISPGSERSVAAAIRGNPSFTKVNLNPDNPEGDIKYSGQAVQKLFELRQSVKALQVILGLLLALVGLMLIVILLVVYLRRHQRDGVA